MPRLVTVHYLEMADQARFRPKWLPDAGQGASSLMVLRALAPAPEYARFLFVAVGGPWFWAERLGWGPARWREHLAQPHVEIWTGFLDGSPCGYFEIGRRHDGAWIIAYFGLFEWCIGRGCGGHLLSKAVARCWEAGAPRIGVYTCDLDHPHALPNYLARGFELVRTSRETRLLPRRPPSLWQ